MKLSSIAILGIFALSFAALTGCQTTGGRVDLDRKTQSSAIGPEDVRETVNQMVHEMLDNPDFFEEYVAKRPVLDIEDFKNRSSMHLDMKSITDSIRMQLLRSRKFKFLDKTTVKTDIEYSEGAAAVNADPEKVVKMGKQSATQMYMYGSLSEMRSQINGVTDRYYKFTLNVKDLATGEIAWSDEKEIRKIEKKAVLGL